MPRVVVADAHRAKLCWMFRGGLACTHRMLQSQQAKDDCQHSGSRHFMSHGPLVMFARHAEHQKKHACAAAFGGADTRAEQPPFGGMLGKRMTSSTRLVAAVAAGYCSSSTEERSGLAAAAYFNVGVGLVHWRTQLEQARHLGDVKHAHSGQQLVQRRGGLQWNA